MGGIVVAVVLCWHSEQVMRQLIAMKLKKSLVGLQSPIVSHSSQVPTSNMSRQAVGRVVGAGLGELVGCGLGPELGRVVGASVGAGVGVIRCAMATMS